MKISLSNDSLINAQADLLAVGVGSNKPAQDPNLSQLDQAMGGTLLKYIKEEGFKGTKGETLSLLTRGRVKAKRILLVGLGPVDDKGVSEGGARWLGVAAGRAAQKRASLAVLAPAEDRLALRAITHGIAAGTYQYTRYLTGNRRTRRRLGKAAILIKGKIGAESREAISQGVVLGEAISLARDLVNCPANDLSPAALADAAARACREAGIECKVYDKKAIEKLGMPLLLAVNRGSLREPRFVHMSYKPPRARRNARVVLVGKGLTFDAGGLCVKPPASMVDMKSDMAGAAVTIGALAAAAKLKLPVEVHGLIPATDNLIGPEAYRPGDIFPSRNGKSVEIVNTDAEGRLILADALTYACELKPAYLIDHATLTGACVVALGDYTCGLFSNNDELAAKYLKAAAATGESFWRLPLDKDLKDQLKSEIADIKHTGTSRMGGAINGALFLQEFVGNRRWVHLDIAGPSFLEKAFGVLPKGGTGFGVLTAVRFLEDLAGPAKV